MNAKEKILNAIQKRPLILMEVCRRTKISNSYGNITKNKLVEEGRIELIPRDGRSSYLKLK